MELMSLRSGPKSKDYDAKHRTLQFKHHRLFITQGTVLSPSSLMNAGQNISHIIIIKAGAWMGSKLGWESSRRPYAATSMFCSDNIVTRVAVRSWYAIIVACDDRNQFYCLFDSTRSTACTYLGVIKVSEIFLQYGKSLVLLWT